jgi:hypothetical protein
MLSAALSSWGNLEQRTSGSEEGGSTLRVRVLDHPVVACAHLSLFVHFGTRVQLRLLRQRVVMTAQKATADVLLHRLHYALPGWDAAAERRDAQDEFHSAARSFYD